MGLIRIFLILATGATLFSGVALAATECATDTDCAPNEYCVGDKPTTVEKEGSCWEKLPDGPQTPNELLEVIGRVTNWIFAILITVSVIFIILAAFQFVTGGTPDKVEEARKKLVYAVIGIAIALLSAGVDDVLRSILTN